LLKEEMQQVQTFLLWEINMWRRRADDAWSRADGNQDGQAVYALHQVNVHESMVAHCVDVWVEAYTLLNTHVDAQENPLPEGNQIYIFPVYFPQKLRERPTLLQK
jgi:hypothetical protein